MSSAAPHGRTEADAPEPPRPAKTGSFWRALGRIVLWAIGLLVAACIGIYIYVECQITRRVEVSWSGRVRSAAGMALEEGAPCTLHAAMRSDGRSIVRAKLTVKCGERVVYDAPEFAGSSERKCDIWEGAGGPERGRYAYRLECTDPGQKAKPETEDESGQPGWPELALNTKESNLVIESVEAPHFRIDIGLAMDGGRRDGEPLYLGNLEQDGGFDVVVERKGTVIERSDGAPVKHGASCLVRVDPVHGARNCRVTVSCDNQVLYGEPDYGYNNCEIAGGVPVRVNDPRASVEEGDPVLEMDLVAGIVMVKDDLPNRTYTVKIALDPAAPAKDGGVP